MSFRQRKNPTPNCSVQQFPLVLRQAQEPLLIDSLVGNDNRVEAELLKKGRNDSRKGITNSKTMKSFKFAKKIGLTIICLIGLFLLFLFWYKQTYSMEVAEAYQVNSPSLSQKLLIASQGSEFKKAVTTKIIDHYKSDSIFIKVIDVSGLSEIAPWDYNAILLMHTWEISKPPETVQLFIDENAAMKDRLVVLTTSGEGSYKMEDVDAVTGESILA